MRAVQNAGGHVGLTARAYEIDKATNVTAGAVVKLSGGKVVLAAAGETGPILGIAAENHPGADDAMNLRANGTEILVYDNPELIFECKAPEFAASGGTATTVTATASNVACAVADKFNGGKLIDGKGVVRKITDYAQASDTSTFTVNAGSAAASGDKIRLFPPVGTVSAMALSADGSGLVLTGAGLSKVKVVGHDLVRGMVRLMAVEHSLGVEN